MPERRADGTVRDQLMNPPNDRELDALVLEDDLFDRAVAKAQAEAVRRHALLGQPIAVWRDGRVAVEVPAVEAPPDAEPHEA
jgi:hypothetical protein